MRRRRRFTVDTLLWVIMMALLIGAVSTAYVGAGTPATIDGWTVATFLLLGALLIVACINEGML